MKKQLFAVLTCILILTTVCSAHPGRTDKHGGHTNKETGEYHFHNPDGSVTVGTKPASSSKESTSTDSEKSETTETENVNSAGSQIANKTPPDTIVVDNTEKPLQKEAIEAITTQENKSTNTVNNIKDTENSPEEIKEVTKITDENGDTYIYIPVEHPFEDLSQVLIVILSLFALLGFCIFSSFMCLIFKKIEKSGSMWQIILHVPYLIFWLPSLFGNLIFKLYYRAIPSDELDSMNGDDEDDEYEI